MNAVGLFTLYRDGFFSEEGAFPQAAIVAAAGLRVRAISLKPNDALPAIQRESCRPPKGRQEDNTSHASWTGTSSPLQCPPWA